MSQERIERGGCPCGAVRFEARGEPENVRCCHCTNCQKAMSGPFFARALFGREQVTITGELGRYATSPLLDRLFCVACGTRVGAERSEPRRIALSLAAFDDAAAFAPGSHMFVEFKAGWLKLDDGLPQWPGWAGD